MAPCWNKALSLSLFDYNRYLWWDQRLVFHLADTSVPCPPVCLPNVGYVQLRSVQRFTRNYPKMSNRQSAAADFWTAKGLKKKERKRRNKSKN